MTYLTILGLYIPSFIDCIYMYIKEKKLHSEFDKKLKSKGYKKVDENHNLTSLIANEVVNRDKYATRLLLSMFPVFNLYPFVQIITKKLDREYKTILNSLDNQEVLNILEKMKYIFNENTIFKVKENITSKMDEIIKDDETNINNKHIEISENDSLIQLKQKKKLLDEMIYLQEMEQAFLHQQPEEKDLNGKEKQLRLIK